MKKVLSLLVVMTLALSLPASAKKKQKEMKYSESLPSQENQTNRVLAPVYKNQESQKEPWLKVKLTIPEKGILFRYADEINSVGRQNQTRNLPPGLAKKGARGKRLPPGWERDLAAGRTFPQNVYEQSHPIPVHIIQQLPPQPQGTMLVTLNGKIVRLYEATKTIIDVLELDR